MELVLRILDSFYPYLVLVGKRLFVMLPILICQYFNIRFNSIQKEEKVSISRFTQNPSLHNPSRIHN